MNHHAASSQHQSIDNKEKSNPASDGFEGKQLTMISEIEGFKENLMLKVRIAHMWILKDNTDPNKIFSIELILLDVEGGKIQANVIKQLSDKFKDKLVLDKAYYIKNLGFVTNPSTFMATDKKEKLSFRYDPCVTECSNFNGSLHGFSFVTCQTIFDNMVTLSKSVDFIAEIVEYGVLDASNSDKSKHSFKILLQNLEGTQIRCCVWGENAYKMDAFASSRKNGTRAILIIQFGRVSWFGGFPSVDSYYQTSRLFINDDIEEINEFRKRLVPRPVQPASSNSVPSLSRNVVPEHVAFLENIPFKYVSEIQPVIEPCTFVMIGTILFIRQEKPCFKVFCSGCHKKVTPKLDQSKKDETDKPFIFHGVLYECLNADCKSPSKFANPRFMIHVWVGDDTGKVYLTLFDGPAVKLLKKSVKSVSNSTLKSGESLDRPPAALDVLKDQKMCMKVEITPYNVNSGEEFFGVTRITQDEVIMSKLENGNIDDEEINYDSGNVVSHTDENMTPTSPDQLINNVRDDDTIEVVDGFSANKKLRITKEDIHKHKLLSVKLEK